LQKFTHAAQTPVAQVIDVVGRAQAVIDVQKVGERSHHVVGIDIFGQKAGSRRAQGCGQGVCVLVARVLVQDLHQCGIMDVLIEFQFPGVQSKGFQVDGGVHKEVADAAHHTAVHGHVHAADAGVLDSASQLTVDAVPRGGDEFPRARVHHGGGQALSRDADAQVQFLVDFITSHARQVIAPRVKKEGGQKALRGFHRRRFARAQALINLQQTRLLGLRRIALHRGQKALVLAEEILQLRVRAAAQGAQKHGGGEFARAVHAGPKHVVAVGLKFKPSAPVGNDRGIDEGAPVFIHGFLVDDAGGTHKLADNDAFRTVDNEGARLGHEREFAHEDLLLLDLAGGAVGQAHFHLERRGIGHVALFAFLNAVLGFLFQPIIKELQAERIGVVGDGGNIPQHFAQARFEELPVTPALHLNQIGHFQDFVYFRKTDPVTQAAGYLMIDDFVHKTNHTPVLCRLGTQDALVPCPGELKNHSPQARAPPPHERLHEGTNRQSSAY